MSQLEGLFVLILRMFLGKTIVVCQMNEMTASKYFVTTSTEHAHFKVVAPCTSEHYADSLAPENMKTIKLC